MGTPGIEVVGVVCWCRELPKGGSFRYMTGIQLRFGNNDDHGEKKYVAYVKKRYKL